MSKLRVYQATLSSPAGVKLRVYQATLIGTGPATSKLRVYQATLIGTQAVRVAVIDAFTAGPNEPLTLTASLAGGGSADSWAFRRISGPVVTFGGTGAVRTLTAPAVQPPSLGQLQVGIIATVDGVASPEVVVTITLLPYTRAYWSGTAWVGSSIAPA